MNKFLKVLCLFLTLVFFAMATGCNDVDKDYGVEDDKESDNYQKFVNVEDTEIMSSDRVMSRYFDISLFDEENYSDIYLGKKFKIEAEYADCELQVPTTLKKINSLGWELKEGNAYDADSLVFTYETIDVIFTKNGVDLRAQFYNSSKSSLKLSECKIVKFIITNDFTSNTAFNVNGINNDMAITSVIDTLGTPSHFYKVSDTSYYLDYFISKSDRRNGITVFINPVDDLITSIEFSYYK